jgi:transcriptional regulator GlxA family with amidase domain
MGSSVNSPWSDRSAQLLSQESSPRAVDDALEIIRARYSESLTTQVVARLVGLERTYFAALFRKTTGETPHAVLTRTRVQRACELLAQGVKVEAVSLAVGFRARGAFYRAFRTLTGTTPAEFRATNGAGNSPDSSDR